MELKLRRGACRRIERPFLNDARLKIPPLSSLSSSEDRAKSRVDKNAGDSVTLIALDLDPSVLDCSTCAADLLHLLSKRFLLRLANPNEPCDYRDRLPSAVRRLPKNIHTPTGFLVYGWR